MARERGNFAFEQVLPRLLSAYESGRLVPFIGVGMSRPQCADWPTLIARLETSADTVEQPQLDSTTATDVLIRRADRAVRTLRAGAQGRFEQAIREALYTATEPIPGQMKALADIWWPLVLTTNYDDFYVRAFEETSGAQFDERRLLAVVGRGSEDCQRVLNSLTTAGRALLWTLQGHIAHERAAKERSDVERLVRELVIDHSEYRRVTHREPHFRRAFAEVFRHRSFLFLGSGLRESYLQELFGEVLELYGPSTHTHYAIMKKKEVDPRFLYARFQIAVVEYDAGPDERDHSFVPEKLQALREAIDRAQTAPTSRSWGRSTTEARLAVRSHTDLEVIRGPLPTKKIEGECLVLSAGGQLDQESFYVSPRLRPTRDAWCGGKPSAPQVRESKNGAHFVGEYEGCDAFAVRARPEHHDTKDLREVREAALAMFDVADGRYRRIHMQLLAAGGEEGKREEVRRHSVRPFPKRFSFIEIVRAWGKWRRDHPSSALQLALYVVDLSVYREIESGRIDVLELLQCDDIRFAAEIVEDDVLLERRLFQELEKKCLGEVVAELGLDPAFWDFEVSPPTGLDGQRGRVDLDGRSPDGHAWLELELRQLGVVPGSTLHFRRPRKSNVGGARVT